MCSAILYILTINGFSKFQFISNSSIDLALSKLHWRLYHFIDMNSTNNNNSASADNNNPITTAPTATDTDNETKNPVVFYCKQCRTILSDSFSLVDTDGSSKLIFSAITNCIIGTELQSETDNSSGLIASYYIIYCTNCNNNTNTNNSYHSNNIPSNINSNNSNNSNSSNNTNSIVGQLYKSTPIHLDEYRDRFTLYTVNLDSYELGTSNIVNSNIEARTIAAVVTNIMLIQLKQADKIKSLESIIQSIQQQSNTLSIPNSPASGTGTMKSALKSPYSNNTNARPAQSPIPILAKRTPLDHQQKLALVQQKNAENNELSPNSINNNSKRARFQ